MNKNEVKKVLDRSTQNFVDEVESWMTTTPTHFSDGQKEEIKFLMKQVFYTLDEFRKVIEEIAD